MSKYHKEAWDKESRQIARKAIYKHKPWMNSTGPKTNDGKNKSKMNALKTSYALHMIIKEFNILMREPKRLEF